MRPYFDDKHLAVLSLIRTALGVAKRLGKPMGLSGIAGASLPFYTRSIELAAADFVVLRPEVFPLGRDLLMEAGNRAA
jgi:hypothetical protein